MDLFLLDSGEEGWEKGELGYGLEVMWIGLFLNLRLGDLGLIEWVLCLLSRLLNFVC